MSLNGCDISGFQKPYPDLSHKKFVIIKSTQGTVLVNTEYSDQLAHARSYQDMIVGHYHFPAWGDPIAECDAFIDNSDIANGEFVGLDIENSQQTPWPADPVTWCAQWITHFIAREGFVPLSYTSYSIRRSWNWQQLVDLNSGCWDAAWNPNGPGDVSPWNFAAIWQNNDLDPDTGGDGDIFLGDETQLRAYCKGESEMPLTQDDANLVTNTLLGMLLDRQGPNQSGQTSLGAFLQWFDSNVSDIKNAIANEVLNLTPAQIQSISDSIVNSPNLAHLSASDVNAVTTAVINAVKGQWAKS